MPGILHRWFIKGRMSCSALLLFVCCLPVSPSVRAADPTDEQLFAQVNLPTDGPSLLDFFRDRTPNDASRKKIDSLIRQLGDDSFQVREKASGDLVNVGQMAVPLLR